MATSTGRGDWPLLPTWWQATVPYRTTRDLNGIAKAVWSDFLFEVAGGAPPVTGTATWDQAAATWAATATERFISTATFAQVAATWDAAALERYTAVAAWTQTEAWDAAGLVANPVTATAAFVQAAATWDATALERLSATATWVQTAAWDAQALAANPATSTATWVQTQAWAATAAERFTATATFAQTASWEAAASESIPTTATWSQDAAWAALGMVAEDVTADATFEQAAASWLAATSALIVGSGTWEQVNTWLAAVVEAFTSTATWEQSQAWEAAGDVDDPVVPIDANGSWTQAAATWVGLGSGGIVQPPIGGGMPPFRVRGAPTIFVAGRASFVQEPATWHADMTTTMPLPPNFQERDLEELVLIGAV